MSYYVTLSIVLGIAIFFSLPLGLMVYIQTQNMIMNQTTRERFGRKGAPVLDLDEKIMNKLEEEEKEESESEG